MPVVIEVRLLGEVVGMTSLEIFLIGVELIFRARILY
jgi:hypothetical protein